MNEFDFQDLGAVVLGLTEEEYESGPDLDVLMIEKLGVDMEQFEAVARALVPYTIPTTVALSGRVFRGFVHDGAFVVKELVTDA